MIDVKMGSDAIQSGINPVIVASGIALAGVMLSTLISALISQRTNYLNTVTAERMKWIGVLRKNLSDFSMTVLEASTGWELEENYENSEKYRNNISLANKILSEMTLQLNPQSKIDQNILSISHEMQGFMFFKCNENQATLLMKADTMLMDNSQFLLKEEWEKVKEESAVIKFRYAARRRKRAKAYEEYLNLRPVEPLLAEMEKSGHGRIRGF